MKIIKASHQIIDNENHRIHEQSIQIDLKDKFVTIKHNGDELAMSLKNFYELSKIMHAATQEADKEILNAQQTNNYGKN